MPIYLRLYSDASLPDKDLLAHLEFQDPSLQDQLKAFGAEQKDASATIIIEDPNDIDGERYLANTGRSRAPYSWPVRIFTRKDQWFLAVPGKLVQLADPRPYQCELIIARGSERISYACFTAFAQSPQPYEFPQDSKPDKPIITGAGSEPGVEVTTGSGTTNTGTEEENGTATAPVSPASGKSRTGLVAATALFVAASSALAFHFQDDIRAMISGGEDSFYKLKWTYDTSHQQFNVAKAVGRSAQGCDGVNVKIKPVFGSVERQGTVLSYVRRGQIANTDVLSFQLICGTRNISGQIELTFKTAVMPPLAETTIQMSADRFVSVKISDLPIANPENWHWYEVETNNGVTSKNFGMQGIMITMAANKKKYLKFKLQNTDNNIVNGILTILPPREQ